MIATPKSMLGDKRCERYHVNQYFWQMMFI